MKRLYSIITALLFVVVIYAQTATFTQVGPVKFPANPSVQTTGMGRVSQLVYHPTDSTIIYAISASGGVFKSSNEGTTWKPLSDFLPQTSCASLAINPLKPSIMYLGTGDANYNSAGFGVWKSLDGGESWFQYNSGIGNKLVSYIRFAPNDTATLLAACRDGIYKSTNSGSTWVLKTTVNSSYRDLNYRPQSNTIVYAATDAFFYRSFDNGETWSQTNINSSITCAGIKFAVCPSDTSRIYCVVWKNGGTSPFGGVYKSTDNGGTFALQVDTPNILGYSWTGASMNGQGSYNLAITVDPNNANTLFVAAINIWKSTDQGSTYVLKSNWGYGVHADKHGFLFSPFNPNKLFVYHDGGLDRTNDGGNTWTTLEDGLSASEFYKLGSSGLYNDYVIGGLQDNGLDVGTDKKFSTVRGGDWGGDFVFDAFDSSILYETGGLKRNIISHVTDNINGQGGLYAIHPNDSNVMFEATTNVFRTTNLRANPSTNVSWAQVSNITGATGPKAIAYSKLSSGTLYAAFNSQLLYRSDNINATTPTFTKITTFPFASGEQIKQLETYDYDSTIIYAVTNQSRLLRSNDKGLTWVSLNKNLPASSIVKFLLNQKAVDSSMYACTAFGVYYRNRFATNWISYSQGLPTVAPISDMEIMSDGTSKSRLHIATYGRGIWQTDLYRSSSVAPIADFAINSSSSQNCANTFIAVDNSTYGPTSRKWQILPNTGWTFMNGTDSFSAKPEIRFYLSGIYFISLTVSNSKGSNTKTVNYNYAALNIAPGCTTTTNLLGGYTIGIYRFELNSINSGSGTGNVSYEDFSCSSNTILKAGGTYTAWVTNGNSYNENAKIYIDYNNNGVFTDANELVGTITSGLGRRSCSITILSNPPQLNKFLRLRIVSDYSIVNSSCGSLSYGQSEDYAVLIDKSKPLVSISLPKPINYNSFTAKFICSEYVNGFDASDIVVSNATVSNFVQLDAITYAAKITPINNGNVGVSVIANSMTDIAGNLNDAATDSTQFFLGIKSYTFLGISTKDTIQYNSTGGSITCYVPYGTKIDSLIATFSLSDSATAYVNAFAQTSGINTNNFVSTLNYIIKSSDNSISKTYFVTVVFNKNTACNLLSFGIVVPAVSGIITQTTNGGTVALTVPFGTNLSSLIAIFNLSDSANAFVNNIKQNSASSNNNYTNIINFKVVAQDTNYSKNYLITLDLGRSKSCDLLAFAIQLPSATGIILPTPTGGNISVVLPFGSNLSNLKSIFTLSDSAKAYINNIQQNSGITNNDFTSTLVYKIIAQDTSYSKFYYITISVAPSIEAKLLSYQILNPVALGTISNTTYGGLVNITVPFGTNITNLASQFTLSDSAKAYVNSNLQSSGITFNNFTDTLIFTVKAQDGIHTELYKIIVHVSPNSLCDLLSYKFNNPNVVGVITPSFNGGTVALTVPVSTNLNNLIASFTVSDSSQVSVGAVPQISSVSPNDFNFPVSYLVKSQNAMNTKNYIVSVTKLSGMNTILQSGKIKLYPNPTHDKITLEVKREMNDTYIIKILNNLGQVMAETIMASGLQTFDISNFSNGIYSLQIETKKGFITERFLKE